MITSIFQYQGGVTTPPQPIQVQPSQVYQQQVNPYHYNDYVPQVSYEELEKQLFDWQWYVTTRKRWTYTEDDYTLYGISVLDDLDTMEKIMDDWVKTTRSIADLAEWHAEGKEFIISEYQDVERIFNIIQNYTSYVGYRISSNLHLVNHRLESDPIVIKLLEDVVKLQNLGNRLFPKMVVLNKEQEAHTVGLMGFLSRMQESNKLEFDPLAKYGLTPEDISDKDKIDPNTGLYRAVDLADKFEPYTFNKINKVV